MNPIRSWSALRALCVSTQEESTAAGAHVWNACDAEQRKAWMRLSGLYPAAPESGIADWCKPWGRLPESVRRDLWRGLELLRSLYLVAGSALESRRAARAEALAPLLASPHPSVGQVRVPA